MTLVVVISPGLEPRRGCNFPTGFTAMDELFWRGFSLNERNGHDYRRVVSRRIAPASSGVPSGFEDLGLTRLNPHRIIADFGVYASTIILFTSTADGG